MRKLIQKITHPFYKKYHFWYHSKPRKYYYKNIWTIVQPSVFSPKNTISTKVFLDYLNSLNLTNKTILELGCGSGIISLLCAAKGGEIFATDINKTALESLKISSEKQDLKIECIYSDLFNSIPKINFDCIIINPPYYPKKSKNIEEQAWFCGENFEYFESLFQQLPNQLSKNTDCLIILSEDCDFKSIQKIAKKNKLSFAKIVEKKTLLEENFIYKIAKIITSK